jgi:hypothetical protein
VLTSETGLPKKVILLLHNVLVCPVESVLHSVDGRLFVNFVLLDVAFVIQSLDWE